MPALANAQYEEFAQAYIALGYSPTKAARAIGIPEYEGKNMLCYRGVAERIRELQRPLLRRHQVTADRTMLHLARVAFVDPRRLFDENGHLLPLTELDEDVAGAIKGIKVNTVLEPDGYEIDLATGLPDRKKPKVKQVIVTEVKLNDRVPALTVLAKHFKLINDEGDGLNALANVLSDRLQAARRRRPPPAAQVVDTTAREITHEGIGNRDVQTEPALAEVQEPVLPAGSGQAHAEVAGDGR